MIVFMNGAFRAQESCAVAVDDRGLTLGDGVFDTMLAIDGIPQEPEAHFERLRRHAALLKIAAPADDLAAAAGTLLARNGFEKGRHAIRTTLTRGPGPRGLAPPETQHPTIIMAASPAPKPNESPVRLAIAQTVRRNERSPLSYIKSLNYGDNLLALLEARERGADDAILLNTQGNVCCASASNIFIRENDAWLTPPLIDGVMDGITRARFIRENGAREETLTPQRLRTAAAIVLTSSVMGIRTAILEG